MIVDIQNEKIVGYESVSEFAKRAKVQDAVIWQWIKRGKISSLKVGSAVFISKDTQVPPPQRKRGRKKDTSSKWISVTDELPEHEGRYLCVTDCGKIDVYYFYRNPRKMIEDGEEWPWKWWTDKQNAPEKPTFIDSFNASDGSVQPVDVVFWRTLPKKPEGW